MIALERSSCICADSNNNDGERGLLESIDFCYSKVLLVKLLLATKIFLIDCAIDPVRDVTESAIFSYYFSRFFSFLGKEVSSA